MGWRAAFYQGQRTRPDWSVTGVCKNRTSATADLLSMRVGLLGTGAIANKHAQAYRNIGFELIACSNKTEVRGREFSSRWNVEFVPDYRDLCHYPGLDFIDVCTFPDFHLEPLAACAEIDRPILV